ncbi:MAG TPA: Panacea domain-containing protein [Acidobacteriota bacterium]|nr:Panacea domain-containing protein [Acidobacteriota bacterium]
MTERRMECKKLQSVLARLCQKRGTLLKTHAVKLPYLVDVVANHVLGRTVTGARHQAWEYGVVTLEAWRYISQAERGGDPFFAVRPLRYSELGQIIYLKSSPPNYLDELELQIVDYVADRYGSLPSERLGQLTKALNPQIGQDQWGSNRTALTDDDAYARLSEGWQAFWKKLPGLDLVDQSLWSEPIENNPKAHLKRLLDA